MADEPKIMPKKKRIAVIAAFAAVACLLVWGSYLLVGRFLSDRSATALYDEPRPPAPRRQAPVTTEYTLDDLEAARKKGELPRGMVPPAQPVPPPHTSGHEAIQRSLRTVEEINRINEMNRRLMEQQQRMNNR